MLFLFGTKAISILILGQIFALAFILQGSFSAGKGEGGWCGGGGWGQPCVGVASHLRRDQSLVSFNRPGINVLAEPCLSLNSQVNYLLRAVPW